MLGDEAARSGTINVVVGVCNAFVALLTEFLTFNLYLEGFRCVAYMDPFSRGAA